MSLVHRPEYEELLALHALGALDGEDLARLEAHLAAGCAVCRRQLAERLGEAAALAEAVEAVMPPPGAREELMRRLDLETTGHGYAVIGEPRREPAPRRPEPRPAPAAAAPGDAWVWRLAAVLLLAAGVGVLLWGRGVAGGLRDRLAASEERTAALAARLDEREAELAALHTRLAATEAALRSVASAPQVQLAGLGPGGGAQGRLYAGERGLLVVVEGLPAPPPDRVYQLWRIAGGQPYSAGLLADADGTAFLWAAEPAGAADLWAVTLEPAGGVPQPTGEMVLKS